MSKKKPFEHEIDPVTFGRNRGMGSRRSMTSRRDITSPTPTPILNPHRCRLTIPDTISGLTRMDTSV